MIEFGEPLHVYLSIYMALVICVMLVSVWRSVSKSEQKKTD